MTNCTKCGGKKIHKKMTTHNAQYCLVKLKAERRKSIMSTMQTTAATVSRNALYSLSNVTLRQITSPSSKGDYEKIKSSHCQSKSSQRKSDESNITANDMLHHTVQVGYKRLHINASFDNRRYCAHKNEC